MKERYYYFDNLKCILIFFVVFAHFLELFPDKGSISIYKTIYLFHMPLFIFVNGCLAKFNPKRLFFIEIFAYVFLQIIHLVLDAVTVTGISDISWQFTSPRWTLWYLLTLITYKIFIPFFDTSNKRLQIAEIIISIFISLLVGYDSSIGKFCSLSRTFTFAPYFLAGYYLNKNKVVSTIINNKDKKIYLFAIGSVISFIGILYIIGPINHSVLFGSYSYSYLGYDPLRGPIIRLLLYLFGFGAIAASFLIPNKRIKIISEIGTHTFSIYVLHAILLSLVRKFNITNLFPTFNVPFVIMCCIIIIFMCGNKYVARFHMYFFTGQGILKLLEKKRIL